LISKIENKNPDFKIYRLQNKKEKKGSLDITK
jgi:hypothetical protein